MSAGHVRRANPRIAVAPGPADWAAEAIRSGGGEAVTLDDDPVGLVWTGGIVPEDLRGVVAAHPEIVWVQLPLAGVEALAEAGVIDRQRRWTSAKGAYAEPVAEHALALLLAGLRQLPMRARARSWGEPAAATLFDQPVTIVGAGGLATELLRLLEPFRSPVTIVRHQPGPLPDGHPLWDLPNCLITPHTADTEEMRRELLARRIAENVRRLAAGQELVGLVDPGLGY